MLLSSYCFDKMYVCVVASVSMKETSKKNIAIYIYIYFNEVNAINKGQVT